ncbi:MAG: carboxypeptidase-like regulatory domain-containing protein [Bryobacteraceae bacterium]
MNTAHFALVFAGACTSLCIAQVTQVSEAVGVISGTVKGADGSPVASGLVSVSRIADTAKSKLRRISGAAATVPNGSFRLPSLDSGTYRICVQVPGTAWIDPCEWGPGGRTVALPSGQALSSVNLVLNKGAIVTLRVTDPRQLLSMHEGKTPGAHLLLGVSTDALSFRMASLVSQDTGGRNYQLLIPFDRKVNIAVSSAFFRLLDTNGIALPKSGSVIPVIVPSGQQAPTLLLSVIGVGSP